ncbi:MAG TPA: beta-ketoacyl-ACP synthase III [Alphaproteobacteria bacterium]|nr:3-oxoacyl-ACP synthase [Rhodospirillaceae bacterium]HRJ12126.1 beta-ketoacyl-ACP synthase III [Alphaproteobacteria bacterium]
MKIKSIIRGAGGFVPGEPVSNTDLIARGVDTDDNWIRERTGIMTRHIAPPEMMTSDMAIAASEIALKNAGVAAADIDLIILATTTPDNTFPATAMKVQTALGCTPGIPAFDIQAVCSGFIYGLATANSYLQTGLAKRALIIGAETMSRVVDWTDRSTCVLFGDGAGAVVLEAAPEAEASGRGIISSHLHADGRYGPKLYTDGGVAMNQRAGLLQMDGREVYRHAVTNLAEVVDEAILQNNFKYSDLDWLVPHQANIRILESTAKKLDMPMDKVIVNIDRYGNTSAASVPLALAEGMNSGKIKEGELCLLEAMGAGFTWGAVLLRL